MAAPALAPCADWITGDEVFDCGPCVTDDPDHALADEMAEVASRVLWNLSGRRWPGVCSAVVRPCRRSTGWNPPSWWERTWQPSWGWCSCGAPSVTECGCGSESEITLGGTPIVAVSEVRVDGVALAASAYRVDDFRRLVRIDGSGWPCCQDLTADPASEDNTFQVTFTYGAAPPLAGEMAAKRLACEMYRACANPDGDCELPERIRSIVRNGMEVGFIDPMEFLAEGKTGIYSVDVWLESERYGARTGAVVASPDFMPSSRRAGT